MEFDPFSHYGVASIHRQAHSRNPGIFLGSKEYGSIGDILWFSKPPERMKSREPLFGFLVFEDWFCHRCRGVLFNSQ